ncbi:MAG: hypothetical protein M2R45_04947 [Verrucomicrobia subdivision 3 bacterium]|nr:hypothetical protein [Limisphaerales bacterium]MCS1415616.1 hypothetical protein [Limisphaerales bacterium]
MVAKVVVERLENLNGLFMSDSFTELLFRFWIADSDNVSRGAFVRVLAFTVMLMAPFWKLASTKSPRSATGIRLTWGWRMGRRVARAWNPFRLYPGSHGLP